MTRRTAVAAVILALVLGFALGRGTVGASRPTPEPAPVRIPVMVPELTEASPPWAASPSPVAGDTGSEATGETMPGPGAALPSVPAPTALSKPALTGAASWYCLPKRSPCTVGYGPDSPAAAAGPALRVGAWRGSWVTVTAGGRSVRVQLIDWCECPHGRLLDLYAGSFGRLAQLGTGLVAVEVAG